jgi:hypothetical protein
MDNTGLHNATNSQYNRRGFFIGRTAYWIFYNNLLLLFNASIYFVAS